MNLFLTNNTNAEENAQKEISKSFEADVIVKQEI